MRYLLLSLLLALSGCYYPYPPYGTYYYGYGAYPYPSYPYSGYVPGYYSARPPAPYYNTSPGYAAVPQPYYGNTQPTYGGPAATDPSNCGTPDQPKPCARGTRP